MLSVTVRISGFSRAAYRTGFYIPELEIMLDAGNETILCKVTYTKVEGG